MIFYRDNQIVVKKTVNLWILDDDFFSFDYCIKVFIENI